MNTVGYIFIFAALFLIRGVSKGRIRELPSDIGDAFTAFVTGNGDALSEVFSRTGNGLKATQPPDAVDVSAVGGVGVSGLLDAVRKRGEGRSYSMVNRLGPNSYDCSGLVSMGLRDIGVLKSGSFTTRTFKTQMAKFITQVDTPVVNDIVLWDNAFIGHIGVVSGSGTFYSALNPRRKPNIGDSKISSIKGKGKPEYYRVSGSKPEVIDGERVASGIPGGSGGIVK